MNSRWFYILAVLLLLALREIVVDLNEDEWLIAHHHEALVQMFMKLRQSMPFKKFIGCWPLPVFVAGVLIFWITEKDDANIAKQFLLLPIAYVPFSIVGTILSTAEFKLSYLFEQPLVILPFGYIYIGIWVGIVWLLGKARIVE